MNRYNENEETCKIFDFTKYTLLGINFFAIML